MRQATVTAGVALATYRSDHALIEAALGSGDHGQALTGPARHNAEFCETLGDLAFHIAMWDEITLAVITEARRGRRHWSLDSRWETTEAGECLNRGGVAQARLLDPGLVRHRLDTSAAALVDELGGTSEADWAGSMDHLGFDGTLGALVDHVATPPTGGLFGHCRRHLVA